MNDHLNTHTYDGKIDISQIPDLITVKQLTSEQKKERGVELLSCVKHNFDPIALSFLTQIVSDIGTPLNFDYTNGLSADDLIYIIWVYRENYELMSVLETQLSDMKTGFCPQGRTHRLFQTLLAFI